MSNGFGKPRFGGNNTFAKNIRLSDKAPTVARILPPMKSLAETGEWAVYIGTHFGYKGVNTKDRTKPKYRPFRCIEERDYKSKMVLQDCPECDLVAQRKAEKEAIVTEAKAAKNTEEEIKELTKTLTDWLFDHNCDRKWHMNVKLQDGSFAVLQISHKTKKLLEVEIARVLAEDNIEALELDQGIWFRFTRTGKGIDTQDTVAVEYESVKDAASGRNLRTVKLAPLTEAEQEKALKECPDLSTNVQEISYEQIKMLTESSGEDEDVDAILALGEKQDAPKAAAQALQNRPVASAPVQVKEPVKQEVVAEVAKQEVADDEEEAALRALEAIKARKAAKALEALKSVPETEVKAEVKSVQPTPAATPAAGLPVDRAAFMARFNRPKTA